MVHKAVRAVTRLSPESRKAEILKVAAKVLAEVQHEGFLPITVAQRCGVSEGTVYRYFSNKQELLVAIAEEWMADIVAEISELEAAGEQPDDVHEHLRFVIRYSLEVVRKRPSVTRFIFMNVRIDSNYRNTELYKLVSRFVAFTSQVIESGVNEGVFRSDLPVRLIRDIVFGAIEHQTWPFLRNEVGPPLDEVADNIAELIFSGMAVSPPVKTQAINGSINRLSDAMKKIDAEMAFIKKASGIKKKKD